ncbi:MAG: TonB-dependent receptor [Bacteroidales bacterium]
MMNGLKKVNKLIIFCSLLFLGLSNNAFTQKGRVYGFVRDQNGKPLEFVNIVVNDTTLGTSTDKKGYYELSILANTNYKITATFIGYRDTTLNVKINRGENKRLNFILEEILTDIEGVVIEDERIRYTTSTRIDPKTIDAISGASEDVASLIKTLPGVSSTNELTSQYNVRGGNFDENIIYVNGIEIFRPFLTRSGQHEGLSFINPDLISSLSFSAGGFEAVYGDKMSSVLDLTYKKPNGFSASTTLGFLTQSIHFGDKLKNFTYIIGVRQKNNRYLLGSLDEKGTYKPSFTDIQGLLTYKINSKFEISFLGNYSRNIYRFQPDSMNVAYGSISESYKLSMYMEGNENDKFNNGTAVLSLSYTPNINNKIKLSNAYYKSIEVENYDLWNEYWISKLDMNFGSESYGQPLNALGVGTFLDHARNIYKSDIYTISLKGSSQLNNHFLQWGVNYRLSNIYDKLNEWKMLDSAGFTLPIVLDSIGYTNPDIQPDFLLNMYSYVNASNSLQTHKASAFIQDSWSLETDKANLYLVYGVRGVYASINNEFCISPRVTFSVAPYWKEDILFRFSTGYYTQSPTYREIRDPMGVLNFDVKAQRSIHFVAGVDWNLVMLNRQFKFTSELYYKYLYNLIPYTINNIMIQYFPNEKTNGFATGLDLKLSGELTPGVDSWISLSFMKTMEKNNTLQKFIPRPTDQLVNFSIFLQDYIPYNPRYTVSLNLIFGTGLPVNPFERTMKGETVFKYPSYRRVDIGFGWQLVNDKIKSDWSFLNRFQNIALTAEVLNLLQIKNTIGYNFITDVTGRIHFIPNHLSGRMVNLKLTIKY